MLCLRGLTFLIKTKYTVDGGERERWNEYFFLFLANKRTIKAESYPCTLVNRREICADFFCFPHSKFCLIGEVDFDGAERLNVGKLWGLEGLLTFCEVLRAGLTWFHGISFDDLKSFIDLSRKLEKSISNEVKKNHLILQ